MGIEGKERGDRERSWKRWKVWYNFCETISYLEDTIKNLTTRTTSQTASATTGSSSYSGSTCHTTITVLRRLVGVRLTRVWLTLWWVSVLSISIRNHLLVLLRSALSRSSDGRYSQEEALVGCLSVWFSWCAGSSLLVFVTPIVIVGVWIVIRVVRSLVGGIHHRDLEEVDFRNCSSLVFSRDGW